MTPYPSTYWTQTSTQHSHRPTRLKLSSYGTASKRIGYLWDRCASRDVTIPAMARRFSLGIRLRGNIYARRLFLLPECSPSRRVQLPIWSAKILAGGYICGVQMDFLRLLSQWAVVAVTFGGLFYLAGGGQPKMRREKEDEAMLLNQPLSASKAPEENRKG